jgi:hypothetical protein
MYEAVALNDSFMEPPQSCVPAKKGLSRPAAFEAATVREAGLATARCASCGTVRQNAELHFIIRTDRLPTDATTHLAMTERFMPDETITDSITIIYREEPDHEGSKGFGSSFEEAVHKVGELSVSAVTENLKRLCGSIESVLKDIELTSIPYSLDEVELSVELTGTGEVRLIGSIGAQVQGGIKLKFKRR